MANVELSAWCMLTMSCWSHVTMSQRQANCQTANKSNRLRVSVGIINILIRCFVTDQSGSDKE